MEKFRILIVDDDSHIRRLLSLYLRDERFELREAATGEEAISAVADGEFDVVLLDLILPYYGGFRLCQRFKKKDEARPHVIIITADDSEEARVKAKECGADDFLAKPFQPAEIRRKVEEALSKTAALKNQAQFEAGSPPVR